MTNVAGPRAPLEDLLQEVFVRVYPKAGALEPRYAAHYLMRAAGNRARDYRRRPWRWGKLPELASTATPYDACAERELRGLFARDVAPALEDLSEEGREALGRFSTGESGAAYARRLGIPYSTLRGRELAALERLRENLPADRVKDLLASYETARR
jgi:DNA-directed RNA polymerase specialized sigma24 family protein